VKSFRWTLAEVCTALERKPPAASAARDFSRISTDTRSIEPGSLFVALTGDRFDAHNFLADAAAAGATGAVVSRIPEGAPGEMEYIVVENTLHALGKLARHRRRALRSKVVAVAGSNGKTTTKDLLRAVLGARFRVHATAGNLNNQIGVPLTLLAALDDAEVLVVEIGTNEPGEIAILTALVEPDAGIITAIAEEHLEKLGDLAGVLREETALLAGLPPHALAIVAEEPPELLARARELVAADLLRVAGFSEAADLRPDGGADGVELLPDGTTRWTWEGIPVHLPLRGRFQVRNALLALGLARAWGVVPQEAVAALERMPIPSLRGEWKQFGALRVIVDCYNSNPVGLSAAVDLLAALPADAAKVAVVGTMRELGEQTEALHHRAAMAIAEHVGRGIDRVIATGVFVDAFAPLAARLGERLILCTDPLEAYHATAASLRGNETVLLKASRGEALERWVPLLEEQFAPKVLP
jgi:UDP-N-acetylmuramoyl-tripeptide--D-alanyl-D-alanine ligase